MWPAVIAFLLLLNLIGQANTLYATYQRSMLADEGAAAYSVQVDEMKQPISGPGRDCRLPGGEACGI
jgi:hypothetical protein